LALGDSCLILVRAADRRAQDDLPTILAHSIDLWTRGRTRRLLTQPRSIQRLLESRGLVILIDGLDEVTGDRREALLNTLAMPARNEGYRHINVVVTCRTRQDPGNKLGAYETCSILDLSDDAASTFIATYAENRSQSEVYAELRDRGFLEPGGLGRNAFWLVELIRAGGGQRARSAILRAATDAAFRYELEKLPGSRRTWRRPEDVSDDAYVDTCRSALCELALHMRLNRTETLEQVRQLLTGWLNEVHTVGAVWSTPDQILELARDAGVLARTLDPVGFSHRLVQENFLAAGVARDPARLQAELGDLIANPEYWQALSMYAGGLAPTEREAFSAQVHRLYPSATGLACALSIYIADAEPLALRTMPAHLYEALTEALVTGEIMDVQLRESLRQFIVVGHDDAARFLGLLLADPRPVLRARVFELLAGSTAPEALRLLASVGLDERDQDVANQVVTALADFGAAAVWPLIRQLFGMDSGIRRNAIAAHAKIGSPIAVNFLLECEGDDEELGRALAACGRRSVGRLLVALQSGIPAQQRRAAFALAPSSDRRAYPALARAVRSPAPEVREAAVAALEGRTWTASADRPTQIPTHSPIGQALSEALKDPRYDVRMFALERLTSHPEPNFVPVLRGALHDQYWRVRTQAVRAIASQTYQDTTEILVSALQDPDEDVRAEAAFALTGHTDPEITSVLRSLVADDHRFASSTASTVSKVALTTLAPSGLAASANPDVLELFRSASDEARRVAIEMLSDDASERAAELLIQASATDTSGRRGLAPHGHLRVTKTMRRPHNCSGPLGTRTHKCGPLRQRRSVVEKTSDLPTSSSSFLTRLSRYPSRWNRHPDGTGYAHPASNQS
jgi:HEAT repeat protein